MTWHDFFLLQTAAITETDSNGVTNHWRGIEMIEEEWRLSIMTPEARANALKIKKRYGRC